ncbi:MAG TPA: RHS repeat-associated core domain-containing protein [Acidobacteriota bacterium]|nr:RHS repeat-associated core domain-containing protein [Acidobacteriota bacterium]
MGVDIVPWAERRLPGRLVVENDTRPGGGLHNFFRDHLGSTQVTADFFTGALVCSSFYHPFGQSADPTACDGHTRKFTQKERDPESALDYFGARYCDSVSARFLSPDPLLDSAYVTDPQSWNRYFQSRNNPTRYFDPDGLQPLDGTLLQFFNAFFGQDLSTVDVQTGIVARIVTSIAGANGVTLGQTVYLDSGSAEAFENRLGRGITLVGHELVHTQQFQAWGPLFLPGYLQNYSFNRTHGRGVAGMPAQEAYESIQAESLAFAVSRVIQRFLDDNPGIFDKLQSNTPLTPDDLKRIGNALSEAARNGDLKEGYHVIDGKLVFIYFPQAEREE